MSERRDGGWECSCPAWTRRMPRQECKHIRKVQDANTAMTNPNPACRPQPAPTKHPAEIVFQGYTIRRRMLDDTLDTTPTTDSAFTGRSRREI